MATPTGYDETIVKQIADDIRENANYRTTGSTTKAKAYVDAVEKYLYFPADVQAGVNQRISINLEVAERRLNAAIDWLERADKYTPRVIHRDVRNYRH